MVPWAGEPQTVDEILNEYFVEAKISGRVPGTTFFWVQKGGLQVLPSRSPSIKP